MTPIKNQKNIDERGLSFEDVRYFDWDNAQIAIDERFKYGEMRYIALGYVADRLHVLVFTPTDDGVRVISFRKANKREMRHYEQAFDR